MDFSTYLGYARMWLGTGQFYAPEQLQGPYVVEALTANTYPPTLLYLLAPFALGLPWPLWWATPFAIAAAALRTLTVTRREVLVLALFLACYPRWWIVLLLGNPSLWVFAFILAGLAWAWPGVLSAIKLTFLPFAVIGARSRRWWVALAVLLVVSLPFGTLWLDYAESLRNASSERGLSYLLGEWPIAVAMLVVGVRGQRRRGGPSIRNVSPPGT